LENKCKPEEDEAKRKKRQRKNDAWKEGEGAWKTTEANPFNGSSRRSRVGGYRQNWPDWKKCLLEVAAMRAADC